jgi:hypothetical protein
MKYVPGDCADDIATLADYAINEARERARLYAVPAEWSARVVSGDIGDFNVKFRVRRMRRK